MGKSKKKTMLKKENTSLSLVDEENYIGRVGTPSMAGFTGEVVSQRKLKKDLTNPEEAYMIVVYFNNGYCCNSKVVKWEESNDKGNEESIPNKSPEGREEDVTE